MAQASTGSRPRSQVATQRGTLPSPRPEVAPRRTPPTRTGGLSNIWWSLASAARALVAGIVTTEVVILLLWAADTKSGASASQAARSGLIAWCWVHHGIIHIPGGVVGFTPPGLLAFPIWLGYRAARLLRAHRLERWRDGVLATAGLAIPYALMGAGVASVAATQGLHADPVTTGLGAFVLVATGAGVSYLRGPWRQWWSRCHAGFQLAVRTGVACLAGLVATGAAICAASLAWHFSAAVDLSRAVSATLMATVGLLLIGVALAPAAAVWAMSLAAGPGFAIGAHTSVTAAAVHLTGVPAISLVAALPATGTSSILVRLTPLVMLAVGVLAGFVMHRQGQELLLVTRCGWSAAAGLVTGTGAALLVLMSSGPVAPGRLATVGPSAWHVGLAVTEEVALLAAATVGLLHWLAVRRNRA